MTVQASHPDHEFKSNDNRKSHNYSLGREERQVGDAKNTTLLPLTPNSFT